MTAKRIQGRVFLASYTPTPSGYLGKITGLAIEACAITLLDCQRRLTVALEEYFAQPKEGDPQ